VTFINTVVIYYKHKNMHSLKSRSLQWQHQIGTNVFLNKHLYSAILPTKDFWLSNVYIIL